MIRCSIAVAYFSYLLFAGTGMAGGLSNAEHVSKGSYQSNICVLLMDDSKCPR